MAQESQKKLCIDKDFKFIQPSSDTSGKTSSPSTNTFIHGKRLCDVVYAFHEPPSKQVAVEIVFIHGLEFDGSKDAYWKTWLARDGTQDNCWPETWLVEKFPHARILSLSYDANVVQTPTTGRMDLYCLGESLIQQMTLVGIGQHDCPVVFVCHSFGGLVAKQIVVTASHNFQHDKEVQNFLHNLRAFYFYATPHFGAQLDYSPWYRFTSKGSCMNYLEVFSREVGRLNFEFVQIQQEIYNNEWSCFYFGEMHASMDGRVVVPESSARQPGGRFLPLSVGHFDICRPQSKVDSGYLFLINGISKVIEYNEEKQCHPLDLPNGLVGMEDKKNFICEKLGTISIFGLVGMGGIGKTTISKSVYNSQAKFYDKACFLQDVRSKNLASLQKELLLELCGITVGIDHVSLNHLQSIKQCIMGKRVLIVIDDVGDSQTLKGLQLSTFQKSLSHGSRVIVTCRNRQVLDNHIDMEGLKDVEIMDVEFLNDAQALELFRYHVYHGIEDDEMEAFESLTKDVARACCGLPLSLEVIGQHLRKQHMHHIGMRKGMWEEALWKLHEAETFDGGDENEVLWKRLKISYDDLSNDTKSMFLDFACFFCEKPSRDLTEQSIGWIWNSPIGLQNLLARSLIVVGGISKFGRYFTIHDQLRDMGRRIVKDLSLEDSRVSWEKVTRLWEAKDVVHFLEENEGSDIIEGISLENLSEFSNFHPQEGPWLMGEQRIQRFDSLRLLNLTDCKFEVIEFFLKKCLKELSWLCLDEVIMDMPHSIEGIGFCTRLRVLQMREVFDLEELPTSFGNLVHLLELDLSFCSSLKSLPCEIGHLKQLKSLNLSDCYDLEEIPPSVSQLTKLEYLGLGWCSKLVSMVEFETQMDHLYELDIRYCTSLQIPFKSLGKLHQLRALNMKGCEHLVIENPCESFGHLSRLEKLSLLHCNSLISGFCLESFNGDHVLEEVERSWNFISESFSLRLQELRLPIISQARFSTCPKLKVLKVYNGFHLKELPAYFGEFTQLEFLSVQDNGLGYFKKLSDKLCNLRMLKELRLINMKALKSLPDNLGDLSSLKTLEISHMTKIEELPTSLDELFQLEYLYLYQCTNLSRLPESITSLTRLSQLTLKDCVKLVELPTSLGHLSQLKRLSLEGCKSLKYLPKSTTSLTQLSSLALHGCSVLEAMDDDQKFILEKLKQGGCDIYL